MESEMNGDEGYKRLPPWLRSPLPTAKAAGRIRLQTELKGLNTVCESARCPNRGECAESGTATFMILGNRCTRNCRFCAVEHGLSPEPPDPLEPGKVAMAVKALALRHAVITSVTRDDLPDGGSGIFAATIEAIRSANPDTTVEALIPDFMGNPDSIEKVLLSSPHVLNHNMETVEALYMSLRPSASYGRSLELLMLVKGLAPNIITKSGIMVGAGEKRGDLEQLFRDLAGVGLDALTIGQYLSPGQGYHKVDRYLDPSEFLSLQRLAIEAGIPVVVSGPLVRSSYKAAKTMVSACSGKMDQISCKTGPEP
jgi:lipoic acid synthetase